MSWDNKEDMLAAVKDCGYAIRYASPRLQEELRDGLE